MKTIRELKSIPHSLVATDSCLFVGCEDGKIHVRIYAQRADGVDVG